MLWTIQTYISGFFSGFFGGITFSGVVATILISSRGNLISRFLPASQKKSTQQKDNDSEASKKERDQKEKELIENALKVLEEFDNTEHAIAPVSLVNLKSADPLDEQVEALLKLFEETLRESKEREKHMKHICSFFADLGKLHHTLSSSMAKLAIKASEYASKSETDSSFSKYWNFLSVGLDKLASDQRSLSESLNTDISASILRHNEEQSLLVKAAHNDGIVLYNDLREEMAVFDARSKERDRCRDQLDKVVHTGHMNQSSTAKLSKLQTSEAALNDQSERLATKESEFARKMPIIISKFKLANNECRFKFKQQVTKFAICVDNVHRRGGATTMALRGQVSAAYAASNGIDSTNANEIEVIGFENVLHDTLRGIGTEYGLQSSSFDHEEESEKTKVNKAQKARLDMTQEGTCILAATSPAKMPPIPKSLQKSVGYETCVWFNALSGRVFRDICSSEYFQLWSCDKFSKLLNKGKLPDFIDKFVVDEMKLGPLPPLMSNVQWVPITDPSSRNDFDVVCTGDLALRSGINVTISTKIWIHFPTPNYANIPVALHLEITEISGRVKFGFEKGFGFLSFLEEPVTQFKVHSEVGDHYKLPNIPSMSSFLIKKINEKISKQFVDPACHKFRLPWPRTWWPQGTEDMFMPTPLSDDALSKIGMTPEQLAAMNPEPLSLDKLRKLNSDDAADSGVPGTSTPRKDEGDLDGKGSKKFGKAIADWFAVGASRSKDDNSDSDADETKSQSNNNTQSDVPTVRHRSESGVHRRLRKLKLKFSTSLEHEDKWQHIIETSRTRFGLMYPHAHTRKEVRESPQKSGASSPRVATLSRNLTPVLAEVVHAFPAIPKEVRRHRWQRHPRDRYVHGGVDQDHDVSSSQEPTAGEIMTAKRQQLPPELSGKDCGNDADARHRLHRSVTISDFRLQYMDHISLHHIHCRPSQELQSLLLQMNNSIDAKSKRNAVENHGKAVGKGAWFSTVKSKYAASFFHSKSSSTDDPTLGSTPEKPPAVSAANDLVSSPPSVSTGAGAISGAGNSAAGSDNSPAPSSETKKGWGYSRLLKAKDAFKKRIAETSKTLGLDEFAKEFKDATAPGHQGQDLQGESAALPVDKASSSSTPMSKTVLQMMKEEHSRGATNPEELMSTLDTDRSDTSTQSASPPVAKQNVDVKVPAAMITVLATEVKRDSEGLKGKACSEVNIAENDSAGRDARGESCNQLNTRTEVPSSAASISMATTATTTTTTTTTSSLSDAGTGAQSVTQPVGGLSKSKSQTSLLKSPEDWLFGADKGADTPK